MAKPRQCELQLACQLVKDLSIIVLPTKGDEVKRLSSVVAVKHPLNLNLLMFSEYIITGEQTRRQNIVLPVDAHI